MFTSRTLSQWEDLVKYTCSIHENSPNVPHVILVSDLNNYYTNEDSDQTTRLAHMLCACLCDAISYCSKVHNSSTYLTVSTQDTTLETHKLSSMYFPSTTWISSVVDDRSYKQLFNNIFPFDKIFQLLNLNLLFNLLNSHIGCPELIECLNFNIN